MSKPTYYAPKGGLPPQSQLLTGRAVFTQAYAVIPKGVMMDIVTSLLPGWEKTRVWIIARPMSGFAETFSQYIMEVSPGGGSDNPEPDGGAHRKLSKRHAAQSDAGSDSPRRRSGLRLRAQPERHRGILGISFLVGVAGDATVILRREPIFRTRSRRSLKRLRSFIGKEVKMTAVSEKLMRFQGIGPVPISVLLGIFPELGQADDHSIAALAGLASLRR